MTLLCAGQPKDHASPGLLSLDTQTGAGAVINLPDQTGVEGGWVSFKVCPDNGSMLACHLDEKRRMVWSVFSCYGKLVNDIPVPVSGPRSVNWAPGGYALSVHATDGSHWVWEITAPAAVKLHSPVNLGLVAWAAPYIGRIVVEVDGGIVVQTATAACSTCALAFPVHVNAGNLGSMEWGTRLAALTCAGPGSPATLCVGSLWASPLPQEPVATWLWADTQLAPSPCGELCAVVCRVLRPGNHSQGCLAVVHLASSRVLEILLHSVDTWQLSGPPRWSDDCAAVLVSDTVGHSQLFRFAGGAVGQ